MANERYTDADLEEFRVIISKKLADAEADFKYFQGQLDHSDKTSGGTSEGTSDLMEDGANSLSREKMAELSSRQRKFIQQLKGALVRVDNKSYGICRDTGKLISKERLKIVPHTTLSIEAKNAQNKD